MPVQRELLVFARRQMEAAAQQISDARERLRLEQRPWLSYHGFALETRRAGSSEPWVERPLREEDEFRVRMRIRNWGETPAILFPLNSQFSVEPQPWTAPANQESVFVMPGEEGRRQYTRRVGLTSRAFEAYSEGTRELALWVRLRYCDITQRRHWVQFKLTHRRSFPPNVFLTPSVTMSPNPGEANHPDCQS